MSADVVFVGGGPIGLASAWRAAQAGLDVVVCDPQPGSGAADVAAGMIAAVSEAWFGEEALTALTVESAARWPAFAADVEKASGQRVGFAEGGTLLVAYDADDLAVVDRLIGLHERLGLGSDVTRLRPAALRRREPGLAPSVRGGAAVAVDHRVDPRALCTALTAAIAACGVSVCRQRVERIDIDIDAGRATGVTLSDGSSVEAGAVVVAAGCWSGTIDGLPVDVASLVRPVKGEVVTVASRPGAPPLVEHTVRGYVRGSTVYLVPRDDGRIVVGATSDDRGFDTTVTAGGVYRLLRDATLLVPGVDEMELVEARAGLRPGTADNVPIIGRTEIDGLIVATGHYRNGILLTPITADGLTAILTDGVVPDVIAPCDPGRSIEGGRKPTPRPHPAARSLEHAPSRGRSLRHGGRGRQSRPSERSTVERSSADRTSRVSPSAPVMGVVLNGEPRTVICQATIGALIDQLATGRSGIAVALNGDIVPAGEWDVRRFHEGDRIDVLTAAQGG